MKLDFNERVVVAVALRNRRAREIVNVGFFGLLAMAAALSMAIAHDRLGEVLAGVVFSSATTLVFLSAFSAYRTNLLIVARSIK